MTDKVLLTGISGWIAKHTAIELLNKGYEVLGTVRNKDLIDQTKETIKKHAPIEKLSFILFSNEVELVEKDSISFMLEFLESFLSHSTSTSTR